MGAFCQGGLALRRSSSIMIFCGQGVVLLTNAAMSMHPQPGTTPVNAQDCPRLYTPSPVCCQEKLNSGMVGSRKTTFAGRQ